MNNANVIKDKFINFLKVNNALENFKNALKEGGSPIPNLEMFVFTVIKIEISESESLISGAFSWDRTPEGYDYWYGLDYKWRIVNNINVQ